jgi:hypothetical protein
MAEIGKRALEADVRFFMKHWQVSQEFATRLASTRQERLKEIRDNEKLARESAKRLRKNLECGTNGGEGGR